MWNITPLTHARRMEVYFYFDIQGDNVVFHLMGEPDETRHTVRNEQAVIRHGSSTRHGHRQLRVIWAMVAKQTFQRHGRRR